MNDEHSPEALERQSRVQNYLKKVGRQPHQSQKDLERQSRVANHLNKNVLSKRGLVAVKNPDLDSIDLSIKNSSGEVVSLAEVKWRFNDKNKYPTYMISKHKFDNGTKSGKPFLIIVSFNGDIWSYKYRPEHLDKITFSTGGRWDRGDVGDVECCAYIPMELFDTHLGNV